MTIYDISFSLGYENLETFIRNFKKKHGISPSQYQKENLVEKAGKQANAVIYI